MSCLTRPLRRLAFAGDELRERGCGGGGADGGRRWVYSCSWSSLFAWGGGLEGVRNDEYFLGEEGDGVGGIVRLAQIVV